MTVIKADPSLIEPEWGEPPKIRGRGRPSLWPRRLQPLVEHPGQWALIYKGKLPTCYRSVYMLRNNGLRLPDGTTPEDWGFAARANPDAQKGGVVYACYKP